MFENFLCMFYFNYFNRYLFRVCDGGFGDRDTIVNLIERGWFYRVFVLVG